MLRTEYLNQTFNFMPEIFESYKRNAKSPEYERFQKQILEKEKFKQEGNINIYTHHNKSIIEIIPAKVK